MYLGILNKEQKQLFLEFAYHLASIDGEYSDSEKQIMESYCHEMKESFNTDDVQKSIEEVINKIQVECGEREKKIVIFEAIGLAMSDGNYDETEKEFIYSTMLKFGLEESFNRECENVLNEYIEFQNKLNNLVIG